MNINSEFNNKRNQEESPLSGSYNNKFFNNMSMGSSNNNGNNKAW